MCVLARQVVLKGDHIWGIVPFKKDCPDKGFVDNLLLFVDKWHSMWKSLRPVTFCSIGYPPYMDLGLRFSQNILL